MSATTAQRAEALIADAEAGAKDYADRVAAGDRNTALNYEIGILRSLVRELTVSVDAQSTSIANQAKEIKRQAEAIESLNNTIRRQRQQIRQQWDELRDAGLMEAEERDDVRRDCAAFARATGAAGALRGDA